MSKIVVIPDCQIKPGVPLEQLTWAGKYIAEKRPDIIVQIGDFVDMESLSSYDIGKRSFEGRRYKKDIEAAEKGMSLLMAPIQKQKSYKPRLVITLGNHCDRITRATDTDSKLEGVLSLDDLPYKKYGWEVFPFLKPVIIDGIAFSHYFPSGQLGRPIATARTLLMKLHMSCIAGHLQGRDIFYAKRADGKNMTAIIAGSYYQHNEAYLSPFTNQHWRGIVVCNEVHDGSFDEMMVSLDYLKRKYG